MYFNISLSRLNTRSACGRASASAATGACVQVRDPERAYGSMGGGKGGGNQAISQSCPSPLRGFGGLGGLSGLVRVAVRPG